MDVNTTEKIITVETSTFHSANVHESLNRIHEIILHEYRVSPTFFFYRDI